MKTRPRNGFQRELELVHDVEETLERFAGQERLDLFACGLVIEQLDLVAVLARKAQHEFAEAAVAGPLGEDPADDADDIRRRLRGENPDEIAEQELPHRDLAAGIDDEPGCRRRQHRLDHHQEHHHEQRWREQIARQLVA